MGIFTKIKKNIKYKRNLKIALVDNTIQTPTMKNLVLNINGKNKTVIIKNRSALKKGRINIQIYGDNNTIVIGANVTISNNLDIIIGNPHPNFAPAYYCELNIGNSVSIESLQYCTFNSGAKCNIGDYCMFSYGITIFNTDAHPIIELGTSKIINYVDKIEIGEHVWVGAHATILKNSVVPSDSIIGYNAVVAGKFDEPHTCIAGNPATVVRKNITWDSFAYEYCQNNVVKSPIVASAIETVDELLNGDKSICRFGDGEFDIMLNHANLPFQKYDKRLEQKLWNAWNSNDPNMLVATNSFYFRPINNYKDDFTHAYLKKRRHQLQQISNTNRMYYSAELSCMFKSDRNIDHKKYFDNIKNIWRDKDIVLVHGRGIFDKLEHNIFDCAKSIETVLVPARNAFDEYDNILQKLLSLDRGKLYILICGPTATVLAFDLYKHGRRALDFGHIAKDYDWFCRGINPVGPDAIQAFFSPD